VREKVEELSKRFVRIKETSKEDGESDENKSVPISQMILDRNLVLPAEGNLEKSAAERSNSSPHIFHPPPPESAALASATA
jgi:hypothetical protein